MRFGINITRPKSHKSIVTITDTETTEESRAGMLLVLIALWRSQKWWGCDLKKKSYIGLDLVIYATVFVTM